MKTLTLLRHAKSGLGEPGQRDFDRTLNPKGQRAAATVGRHARTLGIGFDRVIASPAARVIDTIAHFARGCGGLPAPAYDRRAYLASAPGLLELIHEADDAAARLLVVAHNPGLAELVLELTPDEGELRGDVEEKFPTGSLAELRLDVDRWRDVAAGGATLTRFVRPRDLDPALGPDGS